MILAFRGYPLRTERVPTPGKKRLYPAFAGHRLPGSADQFSQAARAMHPHRSAEGKSPRSLARLRFIQERPESASKIPLVIREA